MTISLSQQYCSDNGDNRKVYLMMSQQFDDDNEDNKHNRQIIVHFRILTLEIPLI